MRVIFSLQKMPFCVNIDVNYRVCKLLHKDNSGNTKYRKIGHQI